jgi:hypothetical protein
MMLRPHFDVTRNDAYENFPPFWLGDPPNDGCLKEALKKVIVGG